MSEKERNGELEKKMEMELVVVVGGSQRIIVKNSREMSEKDAFMASTRWQF